MAVQNLSDLPHDVMIKIAKQLRKLEDFVSFQCVSKSLFAAVMYDYFEGLPFRHWTPYLLLPVRDDDDVRELYSLADGESVVSCIKVANFKNKKCLESLGWLLVTQADGSMSLLEPFSGTEIHLPHQSTFQDFASTGEFGFFEKMVLTSRPSETSDFVLMVIGGRHRYLGFWRLGDKAWNNITLPKVGAYSDVVYCGNGIFYAIGYRGYVCLFNYSKSRNQIKGRVVVNFLSEIAIPLKAKEKGIFCNELTESKGVYIVKIVDGSLLIITRTFDWVEDDWVEDGDEDEDEDEGVLDSSYMTIKFQVYNIDSETDTFKEIYSLGTMAVFLGHNTTTAVDTTRLSGIKANHIYFTEDNWENYRLKPKGGGKDSGIYDMETGSIEPIYPGKVLCSKISASTWITPCM